jgi:ABC-type nitrate/sulfonate/bicarbonate transport system substrate-binding protein
MKLWSRRITICAAAFAMFACATLPAGAVETVNYGVQPDTDPIFIAQALGLLEKIEKKDNVKIEFQTFSYGAPENEAMASGAIQIASAGMGPAVVAAARLPATLVGINILEQTAIIVPADSPIKTVAELKGKTVAFPGEGSQQYPLLLKALADAGLTQTDINLYKSTGPDIPILVENKKVDAGITWDPSISVGLASGKCRVLMKAEKIMPIKNGHYIGNGIYARNDFLASHSQIVQDLVTANVQAIGFILKHPDDAAKMWAKAIGLPENVIKYSLSKGISVYSLDVIPTQKTVDEYTAFLKAGKILKPSDNPKVDPRFAEQALAAAKTP